MNNNLERFLTAQRTHYQTAFQEIKSGRKQSHWMWFIFPQIAGLGYSETARYYAIKDMREAKEFMGNDTLRSNLLEISRALLEVDSNDAAAVMGYPDDMKLKSSMTLFALAKPECKVFQKVLDKFFRGEKDQKTIEIIQKQNKEMPVNEEDADDKADLAWEEISTEHIIKDKWIDFRRSAYRFPDGNVFGPYYSYSRKDYVVVVASDEEGKYLCVRQFRQGIKEVTTEFPAGGIERKDGEEYAGGSGSAAENALEAAKRELLEETGYVSYEWKHLLTVPSNATLADNYAHIFAAGNCRRKTDQSLDETEFLNVRKCSADEIEEMIYKGGFQQAVHIMAWLLAKRNQKI